MKATGDGLQFQWQKDYESLCDGCRYRKTDTDTLHIINVEKSDKGCYRCLVMNDKKQTVVSNEALLTVGKFLSTYSCYVSVEIHFMHYRSKCKFRDY